MAVKSSVRTPAKRVHVISRKNGWAVKLEGASRASRVYNKKESAVEGAKKMAPKGHDIVVHKKDGTIQKWEKAKAKK
ncbi:MAG: DUF2188 domain-containing protein [candidate division Zixibacteria bacterium]|nr:DUF2188 domain-containing protein [Candidatus Tariuqbacter arcticus]